LAFLNYLFRFFRWQMYLKALDARPARARSFQIFMAGLAMAITPLKAGEALKAQLLTGVVKRPWSVGLPAVLAERLTDLMGVAVLASLGVGTLPVGRNAAFLGMLVSGFLMLVFLHPASFRAAVWLLGKIPRAGKWGEHLLGMRANIQKLLSFRTTLVALALSCLAWFYECLVLYVALRGLGIELGPVRATFVYSLSTLAGALSVLPGGLVATEGSMTGLLYLLGVGLGPAAAATFVVRLCTLWFAVFLGMVFLLILERRGLSGRGAPFEAKR
jgi:uncharacterized protein (TIRG00374 family)